MGRKAESREPRKSGIFPTRYPGIFKNREKTGELIPVFSRGSGVQSMVAPFPLLSGLRACTLCTVSVCVVRALLSREVISRDIQYPWTRGLLAGLSTLYAASFGSWPHAHPHADRHGIYAAVMAAAKQEGGLTLLGSLPCLPFGSQCTIPPVELAPFQGPLSTMLFYHIQVGHCWTCFSHTFFSALFSIRLHCLSS